MKKGFLFALFAVALSCAAFSQDSTKTTMHHKTMAHKHAAMHKGTGTKMKTKSTSSSTMSDSTK